jgi:hypothetical protein
LWTWVRYWRADTETTRAIARDEGRPGGWWIHSSWVPPWLVSSPSCSP